MKITDSNISMQSEHSSLSLYSRTESLKSWKGPNPNATQAAPPASHVKLSDQSLAIQRAEAKDDGDLDPKLKLLIAVIEAMTGKKVRIFNTSELDQSSTSGNTPSASGNSSAANAVPPDPGYGMEYDLHESYTEVEKTTFSARGVVRTADGKEINFQLDLSMSRSYTEENNISLRTGNAQRKDPLVINFGGTAAQLSDQTFSFDLDGDGDQEDVANLAAGSGYLALDLNDDGKINDGKELLGPTTDDGFGELASLDGDKNGWIDENDAAFDKLKIWVPGEDGGKLMSLKEAGVGALALAHANSKFELRGQGNSDLGGVRDTGVFLFEDGRVGSLQEIDLTV